MITSTLSFGSYVRAQVTLDDIATTPFSVDDHNAMKCNDCAIGSEWTQLELLKKRAYNHDTAILEFRLPKGKKRLSLPVGAFLLIRHEEKPEIIRPYTAVHDDQVLNGHLNNADNTTGSFEILCKRYDEWGKKEAPDTHFLFTKTDHSYRPPGIMSQWLHSLLPGDKVSFQFNGRCCGSLGRRISSYTTTPSDINNGTITMIAVGVGVAPMIHTLRFLFNQREQDLKENVLTSPRWKVVLLYGVREVRDILMKEQLESWRMSYPDMFSIVYCVGSRWTNVIWGAKSKTEYIPPPPPVGFETIADHAALGWVNEEKIKMYGFPPTSNTIVIVCGLPGVYQKLCGPRTSTELIDDCVLKNLGYSNNMVIKL